jgi:hypothetical protein
MKKIFLLVAILLVACSKKNLTAEDFEKIGFTKSSQPLFQMVGAMDGWKGKFNETSVEIYFYENSSKIPKEQLENIVKKGDSSKLCTVANVAVLDHGGGAFCTEVMSKLN